MTISSARRIISRSSGTTNVAAVADRTARNTAIASDELRILFTVQPSKETSIRENGSSLQIECSSRRRRDWKHHDVVHCITLARLVRDQDPPRRTGRLRLFVAIVTVAVLLEI
jgi:hypothetical protein